MTEAKPNFNLHQPNILKRFLERRGLIEIRPSDICPEQSLDSLYQEYPDLLGDFHTFDPGISGRCQSWRDNPGWWRELVEKTSTNF